ncbi:MAG: ABC transporter ATP-binding protein [Dehalococcoidia bacterium]
MDNVLTCDRVSVRFGATEALREASVELPRGEILALLGPSGCGKTTLLRAIAGFQRLDEGTISVNGTEVASKAHHVRPDRRPVGMVFQDFALFPHLTVEGNVGFGLARGDGRAGRVRALLELAGIADLAKRHPHQLSAGQQQRVAIMRSLAPEPAVLLLDEPFSNLDPETRATLRMQVAALLRSQRVSAILVTHDRSDAFTVADRIAVMEAGRILQVAPPEEMYARPASKRVAALSGTAQYVPAVAEAGSLATPIGRIPASGPVPDGPCEALVRPEWVTLCRGGDRLCTVLERHLEGATLRLRVQLDDGREIDALTPAGLPIGPGERHSIRVDVPVPAFANGGAAPGALQ